MPALNPETTVVIKLFAKDGIIKWTLLGLWSEINEFADEPLTLGMHSATTYYADVLQLGLDPAECLAYKAAQLEHYRLRKDPIEPVTSDEWLAWWMAFQTARADETNLWLKIQKTVLANFRTYTDQLVLNVPPPWAEFMIVGDFRIRIA
jgi:hypothetical protein